MVMPHQKSSQTSVKANLCATIAQSCVSSGT